jgi:hypothetical protein
MIFKALAWHLAVFVGLPAGFFTLASTLRCAHMIALGDIELARAMFVAAWICGTVTILAFWPRGNL